MVHPSIETLCELLDGGPAAGAGEHIAACPECQGQLEELRKLRAELRDLPPLDPPAGQWEQIEARLPIAQARGRRLSWSRPVTLRAAAVAAVFVIGLGLGRMIQPGESEPGVSQPVAGLVVADQPAPASLADAMADVRRLGSEYDLALRNLERLAEQQGATVPTLAQQRLVSLEALVEASRTALAADPTDPTLNSYLFAAIEERDAMMRQLTAAQGTSSDVVWR